MDKIQKELIKAGRKDLAQEYYEKTGAKLERNDIEFDTIGGSIDVQLSGFWTNKDEFKVGLNSASRGSIYHKGIYPKDVGEGDKKIRWENDLRDKLTKDLKKVADKFDSEVKKVLSKYNIK